MHSTRIVAAAIALTGALTAASTAHGQSARACVPAPALAERLASEYGEVLTAAGVDANGNLVQVYSSDAKGTWTIAVTVPGGPTCVVSSGEGWTRENPEPAVPPGQSS